MFFYISKESSHNILAYEPLQDQRYYYSATGYLTYEIKDKKKVNLFYIKTKHLFKTPFYRMTQIVRVGNT